MSGKFLTSFQLSFANAKLHVMFEPTKTTTVMPLLYVDAALHEMNSPFGSLVKAPPCQLPTFIEPYGPRASAFPAANITASKSAISAKRLMPQPLVGASMRRFAEIALLLAVMFAAG